MLPKINLTFAIQLHQLLRFATVMVVGIILAKSGVELRVIGYLEGLQYIGMALSMFWVNGFLQSALAFFPDLEKTEKQAFFRTIYCIFLTLSILIFSVLAIFQTPISIFFTATTLPFFQLFALYLLVYLPTNLLEYFYLLEEKKGAILWTSGLTFFATGLFCLGLFFFHWSIKEVILAWLGIGTIRHFFLLKHLDFTSLNFSFFLHKEQFIQYLKLSSPLIAYAFVGQYAVNFDAWLVNFYYHGDATKFAIFRFGSRELPIFIAFATGLSSSMTLEIAKNGNAALSLLKEKSLRLMHYFFPLGILLIVSSNYWFPLLFNAQFKESVVIFDIFILLIISRLLFPQSVLLAKKESSAIFIISIIELFINVLLSILGVQYFGLVGIAFGTFIAFLMEKIVLAAWLWKKYKISPFSYIPIGFWSMYSFLIFIVFLFKIFFWRVLDF